MAPIDRPVYRRQPRRRGQFIFANLGVAGDKPVPGDYDKDGKTDPAVWRAANTGWFYLESSNDYNTFNVIGFGSPGDIAPQGSAQ